MDKTISLSRIFGLIKYAVWRGLFKLEYSFYVSVETTQLRELKNWYQQDMLQAHIRICWEGVERRSEKEVLFINDNCWFSLDVKIELILSLPCKTLCLIEKITCFIYNLFFKEYVPITALYFQINESSFLQCKSS